MLRLISFWEEKNRIKTSDIQKILIYLSKNILLNAAWLLFPILDKNVVKIQKFD